METSHELFEDAVSRHEAGRLHEAESMYRQILASCPDDADVLELLGVVTYQLGRKEAALELLQKAEALNPQAPDCHYHLGMVLEDLGRPNEALDSYRRAAALKPDFAEAHHRAALILKVKNDPDAAVSAFRLALASNPEFVEAHNNLATVLKSQGKFDQAVAAYRQAVALRPDLPDIHANLGNALVSQGNLEEAIEEFRQSLSLRPENPDVCNKLGLALMAVDRPRDAAAAYRRGLISLPSNAPLRNNLGNALLVDGDLIESVQQFRKAIDLDPSFFLAYVNLGNVLKDIGQIAQAIASYKHALTLRNDPYFYSNLLFSLHLLPQPNPEATYLEHLEWNRIYAQQFSDGAEPHTRTREPQRRLRVGYVSSDLRQHSVPYFLENLLSHHDPAEVEVFAYADLGRADAVTERLRRHIHQWRSLNGMDDQAVADLIRKDEIDILVDLAGHTAGNRLLVFARKPAPVQVTYLGYPDTSGLSAMDYRMTDAYADPPGETEQYHSEKLLRLPRTFACYRPPAEATDVSPLPALTYGGVTFGAFTTLAKTPPALLDCWGEILEQTPGSRLLIAAAGLQAMELQEEIQKRFQRHGVEKNRLELLGKRSLPEYFALHNRVDIYLDTFPVNGHTVTCHALWMGLPVITLAGQVHCQRLGASVLNNLGLAEWIANTPANYVRLAVELAGDLKRLENLRGTLRERMKNSPLLDAGGFAREVEQAYRRVWEDWCNSTR
ncbi:MAG: tetratricopeptide repeat protein [Tepidisphaeraceae bacterium]|jgi:predicted O-linked N-acetylglucosamine transferase (SPINDLY family)